MQRRSLIAAIIAATAGAGAAAAGPPRTWSSTPDGPPPFGRVTLDLGGRRLVPGGLVWAGRPPRGMHLAGEVPQFDEDRLDLGDLGAFAAILRPVLRRRLAGAVPAGEVAVAGRTLVIRPDPAAALPGGVLPDRVLIVHGSLAWEPAGRLAPAAAGLPEPAGPAVGRVLATAEPDPALRRLVLLIPPVAARLPPG
ncbi:MAG: hypothetical protein KJZ85_07040 [Rhodobacteraceae bacterium]|nr:hypothetical protein [Paracoccaceae bacterium]